MDLFPDDFLSRKQLSDFLEDIVSKYIETRTFPMFI